MLKEEYAVTILLAFICIFFTKKFLDFLDNRIYKIVRIREIERSIKFYEKEVT